MKIRRVYTTVSPRDSEEVIDLSTVNGYDHFYKWVAGTQRGDDIVAMLRKVGPSHPVYAYAQSGEEMFMLMPEPALLEESDPGVDFIGAVWQYLDQTDGDESNLFDLLDQAVKTWGD